MIGVALTPRTMPMADFAGGIEQEVHGGARLGLLSVRFKAGGPALFGLLTVALVWLLRRHLGAVGTPVAAFCLAKSM